MAKKSPKLTEGEAALLHLELSPESIAERAYFIAQHRQAQGLPADPDSDWLESENELLQANEKNLKEA